MKYQRIILPQKSHLDPIVACWLLARYGGEKYPEVDKAKISFWDRATLPSPKEAQEWDEQGVLAIDLGGGKFDHHEKKKPASILVAEDLAVAEKPELANLLTYIEEDDLAGLHNRYGELASIVKNLLYAKIPDFEITRLVFFLLDAMQKKEKDSFLGLEEEYEKAKIISLRRKQGRINVAVIESDNPNISKFARYKGNAVVIQKKSSGHVFVFTSRKYNIDLEDVARAIRIKELELVGAKPKDINVMKKEGAIPQVPHWYFFKPINCLLNGSESRTTVAATKIPFDELVDLVLFALSKNFIPACEDGKCIYEKCPYFDYQYKKCYEKRKSTQK